MKTVIFRSFLVAVASSVASLFIAYAAVSAVGGSLDGIAWILCIVCPLLIAWPASAYTLWQSDRLKSAHRDLSRAHAQLAAAHRRLADKARHDEMTGMLNRESFFSTLDRSQRKSDRGALLIIDADHFKSINDRFGHLVGDEALLLIVAALRGGIRSGDVLGRIGGEEFGAFLIGASETEAARIAERMRQEVELIRFRPDGERTIPLTVSIGGTICGEGATVSELMRRADRRLYNAKNRGRNLVVFDRDMPEAA
jgi:diguanylate cyclase (GGDEF)-like protein